MPRKVLDAVREYRHEMDVISAFLDACCVMGEGETKASKLYVMQTKQSGRVGHRKGNNGDYYGVLRGSAAVGMPGLFIEHSFHTNERSAKWLMDEENLQQLAKAEAEVIAKHYGLTKKASETPRTLYRLQCGVFAVKNNALQEQKRLKAMGVETIIVVTTE